MKTIDVDAVYENGVLRPSRPLDLEEKAKVHVIIESEAAASGDDPTGWKTAKELIGCIESGPEDGAENHDRYIYGYDEDR